MPVTDFFIGELVTELLKMLITISSKSFGYKSVAQQLAATVQQLLPIVEEIKHSGADITAERRFQFDQLSDKLRAGKELAEKVLGSQKWNVYKNLQLTRKMEKLERHIARFVSVTMQAHVLADVHHLRFESSQSFRRLEERLGEMRIGGRGGAGAGGGGGGGSSYRGLDRVVECGDGTNSMNYSVGMTMEKKKVFHRLEERLGGRGGTRGGGGNSSRGLELDRVVECGDGTNSMNYSVAMTMGKKKVFHRLEERLGEMRIGGGGGSGSGGGSTSRRLDRVIEFGDGTNSTKYGVGMTMEKRKVKEMVIDRDDLSVVGICGIGGSGKTTLAREICCDDQVKCYYRNRILFLTVSQSPNVEQLKAQIWSYVSGCSFIGSSNDMIPQYGLRSETRTLIVLDDVWTLAVLEQLIYKVPGCKTLVVSRSKFLTVINLSCEMELLREEEAMSLFCFSAFGQDSVPLSGSEILVKQVVNECKGLPLALKVIGASLREKPQMFWAGAKSRLSRGEAICESHETCLLDRMALSVHCLPEKVKECFLDLGSFPEDKKIPLDILINMWVEIHDMDEEEAFAVLIELSDKNLLTLVKDARAGELYSSYYEITVTQHDVLRDLALNLSKRGSLNDRRRLLMPRREIELPKEWLRNTHQPFNAQIVSIHTGEMKEVDWASMEFPEAEVLVLNFTSDEEYFLPPFINCMPKLRALILINQGTHIATLHNLSVLTYSANLRSLWFEKVSISNFFETSLPLKKLKKISLVLCKVNQSLSDIPLVCPNLSEFTMDHCDDLFNLPPGFARLGSLKCLSITNCHNLKELIPDIGNLVSLQILRIYACPALQRLSRSICELHSLKYLDISQCVNLDCLPENIGALLRLEKIDMKECLQIKYLPKSVLLFKSLNRVVCDEHISWLWRELEMVLPNLRVQVAEERFNLDWLED